MGFAARRSVKLAGEVAGIAAGLSPITQLMGMPEVMAEAPDVLKRFEDGIEVLDRRDPTGKDHVVARSTTELLRRRAEGSVPEGPLLAIALAGALSLSWQRAQTMGQPAAGAMDFGLATVRATVSGQPAVGVMLERMSGLVTSMAPDAQALAGRRLTAEADRLATDVTARHRSVAEQAARRMISSTVGACDLLLVGDGSRIAGGGTATTTTVVSILGEADRLGVVYISADDDLLAAQWMAVDLARAGIASTLLGSPDALAVLEAQESMRILLAATTRTPGMLAVVPAASAAMITAHASRVLAVVSAFGESGPDPSDLPAEQKVRVDSVVG